MRIGEVEYELRAALTSEPDRAAKVVSCENGILRILIADIPRAIDVLHTDHGASLPRHGPLEDEPPGTEAPAVTPLKDSLSVTAGRGLKHSRLGHPFGTAGHVSDRPSGHRFGPRPLGSGGLCGGRRMWHRERDKYEQSGR